MLMMRTIPQCTEYKNVPNGAIFKVLDDEYHSIKPRGKRVTARVSNGGIYVKVAHSHAINIADHKDAIFTPDAKCRVIKSKNAFDLSRLPDWEIINRGNPNNG